ncbi:MAG: sulfotransferase [Xanthomonadales bacterium]|nr:sulfotransferase [Xanthomonadales bacterium]
MQGNPLFILSCSRSGSTLLRLALNAHPEVAAPPELHLLQLAQRLLWTQRIAREGLEYSGGKPYELALPETRKVLDDIMASYLARAGKPRWCEKSVTSINHLDVLEGVYPEARVIVLVRHAADMVASGLRAIADRPDGYDFEPYLAADPLRQQALLSYWLDKTTTLAGLLEQSPFPLTVRLRYEDLARDPATELARLADELHLEPLPNWVDRIWSEPFERGPGDDGAYSKDAISAQSLGRGTRLDWTGISRNLVRRVNRLLESLDYAPLEAEDR